MIAWSVNYLFLFNSILLIFLSAFLLLHNRSYIAKLFFISNQGLVIWNFCIFLIEERLFGSYLNLVMNMQIYGALIFVTGIYYFSTSFPYRVPDIMRVPVGAVFVLFSFLLLFTSFVSRAEVQDGEIVYYDGVGYWLYSLNMSLLIFGALIRLVISYPEQDPLLFHRHRHLPVIRRYLRPRPAEPG